MPVEVELVVYWGNGEGISSFSDLHYPLTGKFMLVEQNGTLSLVCGPVEEYPYHANLLDRFCRDRAIAAGWEKKPDLVEIYDSSVFLRGGGWIKLDTDNSAARFFGRSTAYGRFELSRLEKVVFSPLFDKFTTEIDR